MCTGFGATEVYVTQRLTKACAICKETKSADQYHVVRRAGKEWLQGRCKSCCKVYLRNYKRSPGQMAKAAARQRRWVLQDRYGLTEETFESIRASQGNACAICGEQFTKTPHIDHDHASGVIRGLLCQTCNHGIGLLGENVHVLEKAIAYLTRSRSLRAVI